MAMAENITEILADAPIMTISVGGKEYPVRRVRVGDNPAYRAAAGKFAAEFADVLIKNTVPGENGKPASIGGGAARDLMLMIATRGCDDLWETLFTIDPSLPREEMEAAITPEEMMMVGMEVLTYALPFVTAATRAMTSLNQAFGG